MCDPIVGLGLAASVAGGLVNASQKSSYDSSVRSSQQAAEKVSRDARLAERERQAGFQGQAQDFWTQTAANLSSDHMAQDEANAQASFTDTLSSMPNGTPEGFMLSGQDSASNEIKGEIARRTSEAAGEARKRVAALSKLSGQDQAGTSRAMALGQGSDFLSMLNGLRTGSLGASQFEQTIPAGYVNPPDSTFADILSGGGAALVGAKSPGGLLYG